MDLMNILMNKEECCMWKMCILEIGMKEEG